MSKNGRYHWDRAQEEWVKVSSMSHRDDPISADSCWWPKGKDSYYDRQAARKFNSKREKRAWMKEKGVKEVGVDWQNPYKGMAEDGKGRKFFVV